MHISYLVKLIHFRVKELFKLIVDHNSQLHCLQMELYTHGKSLKSIYYYYFLLFVWIIFRGKGDYFRLGHGSNDHVRKPKPVNGLHGKKVIQFATGLH